MGEREGADKTGIRGGDGVNRDRWEADGVRFFRGSSALTEPNAKKIASVVSARIDQTPYLPGAKSTQPRN